MDVFAGISWGVFLACLAGLLVVFNVAVFMIFRAGSKKAEEGELPVAAAVDEEEPEPIPMSYVGDEAAESVHKPEGEEEEPVPTGGSAEDDFEPVPTGASAASGEGEDDDDPKPDSRFYVNAGKEEEKPEEFEDMAEERQQEILYSLQQADMVVSCSNDDEDLYCDPGIMAAAAYQDEEELGEGDIEFAKLSREVAAAVATIDDKVFEDIENNFEDGNYE